MDSVTHLAAGALAPLAFKKAPRTAALVLFGIISGEFPDIDVLAGSSAHSMFAVHRGLTHSIPFIFCAAIVLAALFHFFTKRRGSLESAAFGKYRSVSPWPPGQVFLAALLALCMHVYLDCMTNFGTQVFLPFSEYRVALPAMFIIDPVLTVPLLCALLYCLIGLKKPARIGRQARAARLLLAWALIYPLLCMGVNIATGQRLAILPEVQGIGRDGIKISTMPFSPFTWKVVAEDGGHLRMARAGIFSEPSGLRFGEAFAKPDRELWAKLQKALPIFKEYAAFAVFPTASVYRPEPGVEEWTFNDLRYDPVDGDDIQIALGRDDGHFLMQARLDVESRRILAWRYLKRGGEASFTPWTECNPPLAY